MENEVRDMTIIGGGPAGLFAAFEAGMYEASIRLIDSLPEIGGQLTALYPEKYIFDVPGFPKILAKDLVRHLADQAFQFSPEIHLNEVVQEIRRLDGGLLELLTTEGRYVSRAVIVAAGLGVFTPRKLAAPGINRWEGRSLFYSVLEKDRFAGKRVIIVGGGDSALDWVLHLKDIAAQVSLIHRKDTFRAHPNSIRLLAEAASENKVNILTPYGVKEGVGEKRFEGVVIEGPKGEVFVEGDVLLALIGFSSDLGPIEKWGLETENSRLLVNSFMETSRQGIFAIGDVAKYPGKLKLILTGFSEGALAVKSSIPYIRPGKKVRHIHSSALPLFRSS